MYLVYSLNLRISYFALKFRFPYVAVSIGLVIEKKVELGVVYVPILDDWYIALRGYGAFLNGKRLRIHNPPSGKSS